MIFFAIVFILFGLLAVISPYTAWYLEIGWKVEGAEPTDMALLWNRILGLIFVIVGLNMLF
jgi:hypothetical protein